jgi:hypothetical protein
MPVPSSCRDTEVPLTLFWDMSRSLCKARISLMPCRTHQSLHDPSTAPDTSTRLILASSTLLPQKGPVSISSRISKTCHLQSWIPGVQRDQETIVLQFCTVLESSLDRPANGTSFHQVPILIAKFRRSWHDRCAMPIA